MNMGAGLQIGKSALMAGQGAMNIAGNNMANSMTAGYRRQRAGLIPISGAPQLGSGHYGGGVRVGGLTRAIDMALLARLRHARADEANLVTSQQRLGMVEDLLASSGEAGVASAVEAFLGAWSGIAESPGDPAIRGVVVQQGVGLANQLQALRTQLVLERDEIDRSLQDGLDRVNDLLTQISDLTDSIQAAESAGGAAPSLRDARDQLVDELAALLDVTAVDRPDGSLDLLVGSTPIMLSGASLGVTFSHVSSGTALVTQVDGAPLVAGGSLGALIGRRSDGVQAMIARLDGLAQALINTVNRIHVEGRGLHGRQSATSFLPVDDATIPLTQVPLISPVTAGVIRIQVGAIGSENPSVVEIQVNPATDSLQQIAAAINAATGGLTASVNGQNQLVVTAPPGSEFSVLKDETGIFTAIQFGAFFNGTSAGEITVAQELIDDPLLLSVALGEDDAAVSNAIAKLATTVVDGLGLSLGDWWRLGESTLSARIKALSDSADGATIVRLGLESQEQAISGVSVDEEAMNLIAAQTQYEAAARYVSALQQSLDTLLAMAAR